MGRKRETEKQTECRVGAGRFHQPFLQRHRVQVSTECVCACEREREGGQGEEMYQMITLGGDAELELVDSLDPFSEDIVFR